VGVGYSCIHEHDAPTNQVMKTKGKQMSETQHTQPDSGEEFYRRKLFESASNLGLDDVIQTERTILGFVGEFIIVEFVTPADDERHKLTIWSEVSAGDLYRDIGAVLKKYGKD